MLKIENVEVNGNSFIHTYSDAGFYIECDGALYEDAYDVIEHTYTETNVLIEGDASEEDYIAALAQLGVSE